ncbi:siphovirus Gp157 family protein [Oceaniradius stylonematis]|uniref:siphovirus Gp157 family protein n=1 Tax=Oceaniradius stylonematis TaxID=2184161 RepID=UPI00273F0E92|nr:siphovirus Gp157 family protein [Oceaniradius stylonematis]MCR9195467.1 siphovirus Gp157 family protein [Hyphomonas sp.]
MARQDVRRRLHGELANFIHIRSELQKAWPELDECTLADTLEGATTLHEAISSLVRSALEDETLIAALKTRLADLKLRLARFSSRMEAKRSTAQRAMAEADITKIIEPDFTVSLRTTPAKLIVTDETLIPEWCFIPQPAKLDRARLRDALEAGTAISGAELSNRERGLSVRVK